MDLYPLILVTVVSLVAGGLILRRIWYGSWSGAMLGGSIEETCGKVSLLFGKNLKVYKMRDGNGQTFVGLVIISGSKMIPYRLASDQARQLSSLLALAKK